MESAKTIDITEGSVVDKLIRHGSIYLASSFFTTFSTLILLPINTRLFNEIEYGAISTIDASVRLLAIFVSLYLDSAFFRYYYEFHGDHLKLRRYTSTLYLFILIWGSGFVIASLIFVSVVSFADVAVWPVLVLAYFSPLFTQLAMIGSGYLRQNHRSKSVVSISLVNFFLQLSILLLLSGLLGLGLVGKYIGVFIGAAFSMVLSTWFLRREKLLGLTFSTKMLRESLIFSLPLIPNITAGWITGFSDRILLSWYGTLTDTGIYSVGYSVAKGVTIFSEAIFMVYGPMIFAMIKKNSDIGKKRIERFIPYYYMFMAWVGLSIFLFAPEIITILTPDSYNSALLVIPIVLIAYVISSFYKPFVGLLSYQKLTAIISIGAIFQAIINFTANIILIPRFGQIAAAWTTLLAITAYTVWLVAWSQRSFFLQLDYKRMLIVSITVGIIGLFGSRIANLSIVPIMLVAIKSILLVVAIVIFWITGCVLKGDKQRLMERLVR